METGEASSAALFRPLFVTVIRQREADATVIPARISRYLRRLAFSLYSVTSVLSG